MGRPIITPAILEHIATMAKAGMHNSEIAAEIGCATHTISERLRILRHTRDDIPMISHSKISPPERDRQMLRLRQAGRFYHQIAAELGLSEKLVTNRIKNLGASGITTPEQITERETRHLDHRSMATFTDRRCLCCGRGFRSWGIGNRMCGECRGGSAGVMA